jgi:hypothetical protein
MPAIVVSRSLFGGVTGFDVAFFIVALIAVFVLVSSAGAGIKFIAVIAIFAYVVKSGLGIFIHKKREELRKRVESVAPILKGFELRRRDTYVI